jgi:hypothetical protein
LEELVNTGRLKGTVVGGRQDKAVYIPDIYSKTQNAWVDSFLKQNGYLGTPTFDYLGDILSLLVAIFLFHNFHTGNLPKT